MSNPTTIYYVERALSFIAAAILLQTLYFKFTAAPVSVHIFTVMGMEPWGRIGTGIIELISSILLIRPKTSLFGAILAIGIISGAIMSHLFILGIVVENDGGKLFMLAIFVAVCCIGIIALKRKKLLELITKYFPTLSSNKSL